MMNEFRSIFYDMREALYQYDKKIMDSYINDIFKNYAPNVKITMGFIDEASIYYIVEHLTLDNEDVVLNPISFDYIDYLKEYSKDIARGSVKLVVKYLNQHNEIYEYHIEYNGYELWDDGFKSYDTTL